MLHSELIRDGLRHEPFVTRLVVLEEVDSTNSEAQRLGREGAPAGTVVLADRQSAGRGSRGRSWHSAAGDGIYLSILIRPHGPPAERPRWTLVAATAACEACRESSGVDVRIKWPNDLFVGDLKVGGILAESRSDAGGGGALAVGVGINVNHPADGFPADLRTVAISLRAARGGAIMEREALVIAFLQTFAGLVRRIEAGDWEEVAERWAALTPGHRGARVGVLRRRGGDVEERFEATTDGIDSTGGLRVRRDDGTVTILYSRDSLLPMRG